MTTKLAAGKGSMGNRTNAGMANGITDGGYREDWVLDLPMWRTDAMLILTASTDPLIEASSNAARIAWAASSSKAAIVTFKIDGSAEDINSEYQLICSMLQTGSTDTVTFTATVYAHRDGVGQIGPFTATKVLAKSGTYVEKCVFNFGGQSVGGYHLEPGDNVTVSLSSGTHTTDAAYMYGATFRRARNTGLTKTLNAQSKNERFVDYAL